MPTLVVSITLFVLALLIGIEVIGKVPATLHTRRLCPARTPSTASSSSAL